MLCLSRKVSEKIIIGEGADAIEIKVLAIRAGRVQIGVLAPASARIVRKEVVGKGRKE
jgi:carbon storage regulator CsrA